MPFKPSNLDKETEQSSEKRGTKPEQKKGPKTKSLVVHEEQKLHPPNLPQGSTFIDYKDYLFVIVRNQTKSFEKR